MITLSKSGSTITFTFDENSGYLQEGKIDVPVNSLSLVIDESDMATFRKSASNDIFVSAKYEDFGMSKADLETWYKNNMTSAGGGGGGGVTPSEVQEMIDESISGKADSVSAVSSAEYVSSSTTIEFKNVDGDMISSIDASDFVIDGMIDDVRIETISGASYLVIDFNTASGKEDIQIPLTDIFDPSNYYTKSEVDGAISGKADTSAVTESINEATSGKVDTSTYTAYTAATDSRIGEDEEVTAAALNNLNEALNGKQDTLSAGTNITISGNVISAEGGGKAIEAGTNISVTTGATADTINCILPYYKLNNKENYTICGYNTSNLINSARNANLALFIGTSNIINGDSASVPYSTNIVLGNSNAINSHITSYGQGHNAVIGRYNTLSGTNISNSYVVGCNNSGYTSYELICGFFNEAKNLYETSLGKFNASNTGSTDADNTLFSVGNGTANNARHNAFEIRQNGDIYLSLNGQDVKLQDQLGGGGGIDSGTVQTMIDESISGKVDTSSVVTAVTSASTDSEIPTAKAVYDAVGQGGGATYSGGSGINIDSANTISAVYDGWHGERVQNLDSISTPFYLYKADDCEYQSTFNVTFYINDIPTNVQFNVSTHTYTFMDGDSSWEDYVTVEWDASGCFKATPNTTISVTDASCARFSKLYFSGTTENAIDGTLDRIESIKNSAIGNVEFGTRDNENDLYIAPIRFDSSYSSLYTVGLEGGLKVMGTNNISTQMQSSPYKWMSGVTIGDSETSTFNNPSSAVTFNISRNPSEYLFALDVNNNNFALLDSNGDNPSPSDYSVVIVNGSVTVSALRTDRYITKIADSQGELDQYVSDVQYWGCEVDTIPNVVLNINDKLGGLSLVKLTQAQYDALSPNYDQNTLYVIVN